MIVKELKNYYFNKETEQAIVDYNNTDDQIKKNYLFNNYINEAFNKLAEYWINDLRFYFPGITVQETQNKTVSHLLEKMPHYDRNSGRAFSYFTVISKNFLINISREHYSYLKLHESLNDADFLYEEDNPLAVEEKVIFFEKIIDYLENNLDFFFTKTRPEYRIALTLLDILRNRDRLTILNKKAIYLTIREILPTIESIQITHVVAKFKSIYKTIASNYLETGLVQFHPYKIKERKTEECQILIK